MLRDESSGLRVEQLAATPASELVLVVFGALRYLDVIELDALKIATEAELSRRWSAGVHERLHRSICRAIFRRCFG